MPTLEAIVEEFLDQTGVGRYGTADSAPGSTSTVTDVTLLGQSTGTSDFDRWYVWFPAATGNNIVNRATTVTVSGTGVLSTIRAYASNTATEYLLLRPEWHPTEYLLPLLNRSLRDCWQWWRTVLTVIPNGDSEASSVGGSDSSASTTRDTVAADVWQGEASLRVANSDANGYHQYATFDAAAGRPFRFGVMLRITTGTSCFVRVIDVSNSNATIAEVTGISGIGQWHYVEVSGNFPETCYSAAVRVGSTGASDDTNWDDATLLWDPITKLVGPSYLTNWIDENGEKALRLYQVTNKLTGSNDSGPARSYSSKLIDDKDYQILNIPTGANPVEVELGRGAVSGMNPILIESRRPFSDFGALSAWTDSTDCPLELIVRRMKERAAKERGLPQYGQWKRDA